MEKKIKEVVDRLIEMTSEGSLEWQLINTVNSYKLELDAATLVIFYLEYDDLTKKYKVYGLNMFNGTGKPIELVVIGFTDNRADYQLLERLFMLAKDSAQKKQSTIELILKELDEKTKLPF